MIALKFSGTGPFNQQLLDALRQAVLDMQLVPGTQLPSSRRLSGELGVSRNTVIYAYEQLVAEGFAESRQGSGTFIVEALAMDKKRQDAGRDNKNVQLSAVANRICKTVPATMLARTSRKNVRYDFLYGEPAYAELPLQNWARIVGRRSRQLTEKQLGYAPVEGLLELRVALARYLSRSRGVVCEPEQVVIVQGTQEAIDLATRLLLDPGDAAVIEEPHYRGFRKSLLAAGANIISVPVDEHGLRVDGLSRKIGAKLAFVTPSHQFPLGGVLPVARRLELLDWAQQSDAIVFEDDYDGEFRYQTRPIASLQSLDTQGRVIYVGTASKILFPSLRIGWMVVPKSLVEPIQSLKSIADTSTSSLEQLAFADFIKGGHLERHVYSMRKRLAVKRVTLLSAIKRELGDRAAVIGTEAGIHVLLRFKHIRAARLAALIQLCEHNEVGVYSSASYYSQPPENAELVLGYASLTEAQIVRGIVGLRDAVDSIDGAAVNG